MKHVPSKGSKILTIFFTSVIVAALVPVGIKWFQENKTQGKTLAAKKPLERVQALPSRVEPIPVAPDKIVAPNVVDMPKAAATKTLPKAKADASTAHSQAKENSKAAELAMRKDPSPKTGSKLRVVESMNELPYGSRVEDLQKKADEEFFQATGPTLSNENLRTIYNASYSKETLKACRQRCLLRVKDARGQSLAVVINGPEFADILADHQGTINIIGKKHVVKNRSLFMVQNITFNLTPGQALQDADDGATLLRYSSSQGLDDYEDLSEDLSR